MQANIHKLFLIAGFHGLILFYAFDKVFLQLRGLSITEVILVEIVYMITILALEVPSGALSDRWSRKYVLALSGFFYSLYVLVFALGHDLVAFCIGAIVAGIGTALLSGTDTSLLYDSLKEQGKEEQYEKYLGRMYAISSAVFVVAALIGGFVGEVYGLEAAFWLSLPSMIIAGIIPLFITEPHFHRSTGEVKFWQHVTQTARFLLQKPRFIHYGVLITAVMVPALIVDEYAQVYYTFIGIGAIGLGILAAVVSVFDTVFNTITFWFKRFDHDRLFGASLIVFSGGLLSAWLFQSWIGLLLMLAGSFAFYTVEIIAMADINRMLPSNIRATTHSFFSLATQLVHIPLVFLFGYISQTYSIATGFGTLGILLLGYTLIYWLRLLLPTGR